MKKILVVIMALMLVAGTFAHANPVDGPGNISWKGLNLVVDVNATAYVNPTTGWLEISVGGDTGDPASDNWNVHADDVMTQAGLPAGAAVWFEVSFLDAGTNFLGEYGGGPRAYFDTWETRTYELAGTTDDYSTEYMFQGGMYDGDADYYVNQATYVSGYGWNESNWFFPGSRSAGEHTFRVELFPNADIVKMYYDGVFMGQADGPESVPTFFQTLYFGVTSNGLDEGAPGYGIYTNVEYGVIPEPGTMALIGLGLAGLAGMRRRS